MSDFCVIYADVDALARTFRTEAALLGGLSGRVRQPAPDTGDPSLDSPFGEVLACIEFLHEALVETVDAHGERLAGTRDTYERSDSDVRMLYERLWDAWQGGGDRRVRGERPAPCTRCRMTSIGSRQTSRAAPAPWAAR